MATFTYLNPTSSNVSTTPISESGLTRLSFSRNNRPIIYANYPEQIGVNGTGLALAEHSYCINRQTITAGEAQIFFSHWNRTGATLKYRVHIYNPSTTNVTVTRTNCGFSSGWSDPGKTVRDFYTTNSTTIPVPGTGSHSAWLTDEYSIASEQPFNGMIRFSANSSVIITLYAYQSASSIDGNEVVYPYSSEYSADVRVYSGIGTGYFLTIPHSTINVSNMPYRYVTNNVHSNNNEITPINIVGTNMQAHENASDPLNNLGNWCTQNYHTITIKNNTTSTKTVYGYIGSNNIGNTPVVAKGTTIKSVLLENGPRRWKWCKIVLAANESYSLDYQTILASYGAAATFHEWAVT